MQDNIAVISTLVSKECFVDSLISVDPILEYADKSPDGDFHDRSYESGTTVYLKVEDQPVLPTQNTVMAQDPIIQRQIPLTCLPYNVGTPLPDIEREYFLGGEKKLRKLFKARMESTAVQAALLCYGVLGSSSNFYGTAGSDLVTASDWGGARARLVDQLTGITGLCAAISPRAMGNVAGDLATRFNPQEKSSYAMEDARVRKIAGFKMFESTILPTHTNGSAAGNGTSGMIVATDVVSGDTSVAVSGGTSAGTITKDSIIFFKGSNAVQPHTRIGLSYVRHFTVAADVTLSGGAGTITLTEPMYGPEDVKNQNMTFLPTTASSYVGIRGAVSMTYEQAFWFKEDAFAFAGLKMPSIYALDNSFDNWEGVNVRTVMFGDGFNSKSFVRNDILCGAAKKQYRHLGRSFVAAVPT